MWEARIGRWETGRPALQDKVKHRIKITSSAGAARVLDEMEPELRQLDGLLTVLVLLGETSDSVQPIALSSLGRAARDAFETIDENWLKA